MTAGPAEPARAIFFGSGAFAVPILEALLEAPEVSVVAVVTAPDRPAGRGGRVTATPVAMRARELGLDLLQPTRLRDPAMIEALAALALDVGVLADYGRIVPQPVLDIPPHGILNVHPSLLPRHRGASPIPASILADDRQTGVTLIRMDAGVDTGPILAAENWPLDGSEDAPAIEHWAAGAGAELLRRVLGAWLAGGIEPRAQPEAAATYTRPLRREDGWLDPRRRAVELERAVRAYRPWPGTSIEVPDGRLAILEAKAAPAVGGGEEPGRLVVTRDTLELATVDGRLRLNVVQPAGGRPMSAADYLRGRGRHLREAPSGA